MKIQELYGRQVLVSKTENIFLNQEGDTPLQKRPAMVKQGRMITCNRCGCSNLGRDVQLPGGEYYCPNCIMLGRVLSTDSLYTMPEPNLFAPVDYQPLAWQGKLSCLQEKCSRELLEAAKQGRNHLVWAVTGAGKTEMLFPTLNWAIKKGWRIAIASPRVDVCNELYPRLTAAFPRQDILLQHGKSDQSYRYTQVMLATTHQLFKFRQAFDLLVIDEVDAFPFVNNKYLQKAADRALKNTGVKCELTATPSAELLRRYKRGYGSISILPLRFHQRPLPQIQVEFTARISCRGKLDVRTQSKIRKYIEKWQAAREPFLIFLPRIRQLAMIHEWIQTEFRLRGTTVYSEDEKRIEKVAGFRKGTYDYLVTTTILERGVTFPRLNVMVLKADDRQFSVASLVQIAGRCGRSSEKTDGDVILISCELTRNIKRACRQIKLLNRKGDRIKSAELSALQ